MTANSTYILNGVKISEKIIPDDMRWTNADAAKSAGFSLGALYKNGNKLSDGTGKAQWVTIHNTGDLDQIMDDAERYTQATYNQAMGACRPHFYIDETSVWQLLKAGTGLCANDPKGSAEVNWTCGDGVVKDGGNMTSIALEIIMNENPTSDEKAKDNAARIAAWLLWAHNLPIDRLVTHTFWVNKLEGKTFADTDKQCTNPIAGKKWCPTYIFNSTNPDVAYKNWKAFKEIVGKYLSELSSSQNSDCDSKKVDVWYRVQIGSFELRQNAENYLKSAKADALEGFIVTVDVNGKTMYRVQLGAFTVKANAESYLQTVKAKGYDGFIFESESGEPSDTTAFNVGCTVRVNYGAKTYDGRYLAPFVYTRNHIISELQGNRAVIIYGNMVIAAVRTEDLTLIE